MFHPVRVSIFRKETEYDHVSRTIPSPEIRPYHRGLQGIAARAARVGGRLSGRLSPSTTLTSASRATSWSTTRMTVGNRRMRILITSDSDLNHYSWVGLAVDISETQWGEHVQQELSTGKGLLKIARAWKGLSRHKYHHPELTDKVIMKSNNICCVMKCNNLLWISEYPLIRMSSLANGYPLIWMPRRCNSYVIHWGLTGCHQVSELG